MPTIEKNNTTTNRHSRAGRNPVSLITENIDIWSSAIQAKKGVGRGISKKINLYGINKLRYLIIELALTGALVEQSTISAEILIIDVKNKKEIIREKRSIKKSNDSFPPLELFDAPVNWRWTSIGELAHVLGGKRVPRGYKLLDQPTPYAYIRVTDMKGHSVDLDNLKFVDELVHNQINKYIINKEDIYVTIAGTIGAVGTIPDELDGMHLTENASKLVFDGLDKRFVVHLISCGYVQNQFKQAVNQMAQPKLSLNSIKSTSLAIPPLAEQHRIVTKVDELMNLCDQLEQQQESSITAHKILVETLLSALTNAADKGEFDQAWEKIANHFDTLFTTEHSIDQLKQTILQLAVMGKLVPQDPNDEPASVLLDKIAAEKERLIKEKKIKKQKTLPEISNAEKSFTLPKSWIWTRLGQVTNYGISEKVESKNALDDTWVLELEDVEKETSKLLKKIRFNERQFKSSKNKFSKGDVIYGKLRPYLNKILIADEDGVCTTEMIPIKAYSSIEPSYLHLLMRSPYFVNYANSSTHGMGMPRMGTDKARLAIIPIAPVAEQLRVVDKVDELMILCDQLKANLINAQTTQLHLADVVAEQAIN